MNDVNDLLGFGKGIEKLIDVLCKGCDWFAKPYQIKRIAAAERECKALDFEQDTKLQLKQAIIDNSIRDLKSIRQQRQLGNIVDIISYAAKDLSIAEHVSESPVNVDWASRFFDYAKDCSDDEIKILWGKILAGEITTPGSYFKRTLNILHNIEAIEAQWFVEICPYIFDLYAVDMLFIEEIYPYSKMLSLMDCGLFSQAASGRNYTAGTEFIAPGKSLCLRGPILEKNITFYSGHSLTDAGEQIYRIVDATSNRGFFTKLQYNIKSIHGIDTVIDSYQ